MLYLNNLNHRDLIDTNQYISLKTTIINLDYAFIIINKNSLLDFYHRAFMIGANLKKNRCHLESVFCSQTLMQLS